ncbi:polysaccharide deacetylase family protein [Flavisolibacter sp. BT320]|nr:polysaccharide deacetylase family protein [Flavisolibacter longurius]
MRKQHLFCFLFLLGCTVTTAQQKKALTYVQGAIVRGDSTQKELAIIFTADEFGEGLPAIITQLKAQNIKGGFFFTGRFYRNPQFHSAVQELQRDGHYLGPHSDNHLQYNDWTKRDSLLVTKDSFFVDLAKNIAVMQSLSLPIYPQHFFIPPYEWWNDSIAVWSRAAGVRLFSFTPGMRTAADYTYPEMGTSYKSSEWLLDWLQALIKTSPQKLNGAVLLVHTGTDPRRQDKLYDRLTEMITLLKKAGFTFRRVDELLQ